MDNLFLIKEARIYSGEKTVSSINGAACKRMKLEHCLLLYRNINSKWIKNLNIRPDTIKHLEENIGKTLFDINHSKIFFNQLPRLMKTKTKINK